MAITLNSDKALIFRITHIANVPWILRNGLHCKNAEITDPNFVSIGNPELISKRETEAFQFLLADRFQTIFLFISRHFQ